MKYRIGTSNERVWCTTQLVKLSFIHSIGRTHSWRFSVFYKMSFDAAEYQIGRRAYSWLMPDVLVTLQQKPAGMSTTDEKKRCDTTKKLHWDVRTYARRVCMPPCTARCGVKQILATTRCPCASLVKVESALSYRVLWEDWRVCIISYCCVW